MFVFYDPATMQVMALYTGGTTSTSWTEQGFIRAEVAAEIEGEVRRGKRDQRVAELKDGVVVAVEAARNPVQPEASPPDPDEELLRDRLADPDVPEHEKAMIRRSGVHERG